FTLAAIAQNLRRLAKLVARPPPRGCPMYRVSVGYQLCWGVSKSAQGRRFQGSAAAKGTSRRPQPFSSTTSATKSARNRRSGPLLPQDLNDLVEIRRSLGSERQKQQLATSFNRQATTGWPSAWLDFSAASTAYEPGRAVEKFFLLAC